MGTLQQTRPPVEGGDGPRDGRRGGQAGGPAGRAPVGGGCARRLCDEPPASPVPASRRAGADGEHGESRRSAATSRRAEQRRARCRVGDDQFVVATRGASPARRIGRPSVSSQRARPPDQRGREIAVGRRRWARRRHRRAAQWLRRRRRPTPTSEGEGCACQRRAQLFPKRRRDGNQWRARAEEKAAPPKAVASPGRAAAPKASDDTWQVAAVARAPMRWR